MTRGAGQAVHLRTRQSRRRSRQPIFDSLAQAASETDSGALRPGVKMIKVVQRNDVSLSLILGRRRFALMGQLGEAAASSVPVQLSAPLPRSLRKPDKGIKAFVFPRRRVLAPVAEDGRCGDPWGRRAAKCLRRAKLPGPSQEPACPHEGSRESCDLSGMLHSSGRISQGGIALSLSTMFPANRIKRD